MLTHVSLCSEHDLGEDIYDCVPCEDEGDDIYEDIIKVEVQQPMVSTAPLPLLEETQPSRDLGPFPHPRKLLCRVLATLLRHCGALWLLCSSNGVGIKLPLGSWSFLSEEP